MRQLLTLWLVIFTAVAIWPAPAGAVRIDCITTETTLTVADGVGGTVELSATAIRLTPKNTPWNLEVYTTDQASSNPQATCTGSTQVVVTCNGFDTSASAQVWWKCEREAPYLQMDATGTFSSPVNVGRVQSADCVLRLRIVDDGATDSVCFTFAIGGAGLDKDKGVQDENEKGSWGITGQ